MNLFLNKEYEFWLSLLIGLIPISLLFSPALNSILIGGLLLYSLFFVKKDKYVINNLEKSIIYCLLLFILFHLFSLFYSSHVMDGLNLIKKRIPLILIPLIFYFNRSKMNFKVISRTFLFGVFLSATFTLVNAGYSVYLNNESLSVFFKYYVRYFYVSFMPYEMHPTYLGIMLCAALAMSISMMVKKEMFIIQFVISTVLLFNIYMVSSQMTFFLAFVVILFYIIDQLKSFFSISNYKIFIFIFILGIVFLFFQADVISHYLIDFFQIENKGNILYRVFHFFNEGGDITRRKNWQSAYSIIKNNFAFGVGIGDAIPEMQNFREQNTWIYEAKLNAHNQYLEEFVHFGFFGFSCFMFLLIAMFKLVKDNILFIVLLIIVCCAMITESILNRQVGVSLFAFVLSFSFFFIDNKRKSND
jgi:O-antigen ligase